jgi:hypothetical protein
MFDLKEWLEENMPYGVAKKMEDDRHLPAGRDMITVLIKYIKGDLNAYDLIDELDFIRDESVKAIIEEAEKREVDLTKCNQCKEPFTDNDHIVYHKNPAGWALYHGYPEGPGWNLKIKELEEAGVKLKGCKSDRERADQYEFSKPGHDHGD